MGCDRWAVRIMALVALLVPHTAAAEGVGYYVGALGGIATLSGDPTTTVTRDGFAVSTYKPENGLAVNVFVGAHLREYVTVQANYILNRNDLSLFAGTASAGTHFFFRQELASTQQAAGADLLVYFRERDSRIRPYLSFGLGATRFARRGRGTPVDGGLAMP